jgi:hypothetical protein
LYLTGKYWAKDDLERNQNMWPYWGADVSMLWLLHFDGIKKPFILSVEIQVISGVITIACLLNETDTLTKTGRTLVWGSHRPLHGVPNVKSSVANDLTGFRVLTLKHLL